MDARVRGDRLRSPGERGPDHTDELNSFTSGTKQWIRVRAIGANNQMGPWSDPAAKTVP